MSDPQPIRLALDTMMRTCPLCGAAPLTPCVNGTRTLRYTHAERNR